MRKIKWKGWRGAQPLNMEVFNRQKVPIGTLDLMGACRDSHNYACVLNYF